jgi:glycosyltransferase involved in cell wall biosynthesis
MVSELGIKTVIIEALAARFTLRLDRLVKYFASFIRVIRATRSAVICEAPDVVHANSIRGGLVMSVATMGLGMPVVWHAHDLLPRHLLSTAIRLLACASRRNHVIAVSHAVAKSFSGSLPRWLQRRTPVTTIHNAVDLDRFQPNASSREAVRHELTIRKSSFLIGSVGQLTARKGQLELIKAFVEVSHKHPEALLLIVGEALFNRDEEYAALLLGEAESSGVADRIRFLGPREDVPAIMRALDLLVVNSQTEPFGLTVIEAMASGTPVAASAVDGITEIIQHGKSGWLISDRRQESLVTAMNTLIQNLSLRQGFSDTGTREVRARFSTERFMKETQSFYRGLLARGKMPQYDFKRNLKTELSAD